MGRQLRKGRATSLITERIVKLSILNFFSSPPDVVALAELCDGLETIERFWVGEHHAPGQVPDPLALAFVLAGVTERIRVGTGATSLYFRNPYMVAETALMLALFYPGRIDLGVSRSAASDDPVVAGFLQEGLDMAAIANSYDDRVRRVRDVFAMSHMRPAIPPSLFMMGTSVARARFAAQLGIGFVASFHHGGTLATVGEQISVYRDAFVSTGALSAPHAIAVISGYTDEDETRVADVTRRYERSIPPNTTPAVVSYGPPTQVATEIYKAARAVAADEVMFLSNDRDSAGCYRALAMAWSQAILAAGPQ